MEQHTSATKLKTFSFFFLYFLSCLPSTITRDDGARRPIELNGLVIGLHVLGKNKNQKKIMGNKEMWQILKKRSGTIVLAKSVTLHACQFIKLPKLEFFLTGWVVEGCHQRLKYSAQHIFERSFHQQEPGFSWFRFIWRIFAHEMKFYPRSCLIWRKENRCLKLLPGLLQPLLLFWFPLGSSFIALWRGLERYVLIIESINYLLSIYLDSADWIEGLFFSVEISL